eukprot:jgi/Chlat1/7714/Chrsp66S07185
MAAAALRAAVPVASTQGASLRGDQTGLQVNRGAAKWVCKKADIHPKFFTDAKVFCNGELVLTTGGTRPEYVVDIWSGNHPFFQGGAGNMVVDQGRLNRFKRQYGSLGSMQEVVGITGDKNNRSLVADAKAAMKKQKDKKKGKK